MTLGSDYFAGLYEADDDPWRLANRWYERRKYALTIAALPAQWYRNGLEIGCSVGVLTAALASRCERLLGVDIAQRAVDLAAERTRRFPGVRVERRTLPDEWPAGRFDLIVLSEVGYYLTAEDFDRLLDLASVALEPEATLVAVHWRHPVAEYPRRGDEVHEGLARRAGEIGLVRTVAHEELDFRLEIYLRTPPEPRSVAQRTGLV
ncbi:MAG TPA: class I SAM-dependent methyltransferase [Frankiaceae bacterium]|jgi:cyclopropane fatty-acyl-phospholipid synthase-like methyltransferase|nr:class I SAM-dependent methyltransferase [Frankiaceae bacterium]